MADIYKCGVAGEVVEVADGYARNYLIPKKLAVKATKATLEEAAELREKAEARKAQLDNRLNDLARQIDGVELVFGKRASPTGKLFGSVTTSEIADAIDRETGIDINRRRISQTALREVGTHEVPVRLGTELSPTIKVTIVREEELESFLEQRRLEAESGDEVVSGVEDEGEETPADEPSQEGLAAVVETTEDGVESVLETVQENAESMAETIQEGAESVAETVQEAITDAVEDVVDTLSGDEDENKTDRENRSAE